MLKPIKPQSNRIGSVQIKQGTINRKKKLFCKAVTLRAARPLPPLGLRDTDNQTRPIFQSSFFNFHYISSIPGFPATPPSLSSSQQSI